MQIAGALPATAFVVGERYTRLAVYNLLSVPVEKRGGNWATGYTRYQGAFYIFTNVGVPGRTGHDYANYWEDDHARLVWGAKGRSRLSHPEIVDMLSGVYPVHVFTRTGDREAFVYRGQGVPESVRDTQPVGITWTFEVAAAAPLPFVMSDIGSSVDPITESEYLRAQRLGQSKFRSDLLRRWNGRCALTQIAMPEILRASHIKAWRDSTNVERVNPDNGLLLAVHIDGLFDRGYVSFLDDGHALIAPSIPEATRAALGVSPSLRIEGLSSANQHFLNHHRLKYGHRLGL